jgi:hypothetical protein
MELKNCKEDPLALYAKQQEARGLHSLENFKEHFMASLKKTTRMLLHSTWPRLGDSRQLQSATMKSSGA